MSTYYNLRFSKTLRYGASVIALAVTGGLVTVSGVHALPDGFDPPLDAVEGPVVSGQPKTILTPNTTTCVGDGDGVDLFIGGKISVDSCSAERVPIQILGVEDPD